MRSCRMLSTLFNWKFCRFCAKWQQNYSMSNHIWWTGLGTGICVESIFSNFDNNKNRIDFTNFPRFHTSHTRDLWLMALHIPFYSPAEKKNRQFARRNCHCAFVGQVMFGLVWPLSHLHKSSSLFTVKQHTMTFTGRTQSKPVAVVNTLTRERESNNAFRQHRTMSYKLFLSMARTARTTNTCPNKVQSHGTGKNVWPVASVVVVSFKWKRHILNIVSVHVNKCWWPLCFNSILFRLCTALCPFQVVILNAERAREKVEIEIMRQQQPATAAKTKETCRRYSLDHLPENASNNKNANWF